MMPSASTTISLIIGSVSRIFIRIEDSDFTTIFSDSSFSSLFEFWPQLVQKPIDRVNGLLFEIAPLEEYSIFLPECGGLQ